MHHTQHPVNFHGIGNYTFPLLAHLAQRSDVKLFYFQPIYQNLSNEEFTVQLSKFIQDNDLDIFHFPSPMTVPFSDPIIERKIPPILYTAMVHDLIPLVFPDIYLPNDFIRIHYEKHMEMIRSMDHLLTNTEYSRSDLLRFGFEDDSITTIGFGRDESFYIHPNPELSDLGHLFPIDKPYLLAISAGDSRKNTVTLIQAFANAVRNTPTEFQLVIAGGLEQSYLEQLLGTATRYGIRNRVHFPGRVTKPQLLRLFNRAHCFAFPSLYEGVGLPPLEAMQCGVPVLTSSTTSLPEVTGDAAILVDPKDVNAMSQGLLQLLTNEPLRHSLRVKGLQRAQLFDWNQVADRIVTAFRKLIERRDAELKRLLEEFQKLKQDIPGYLQQELAPIHTQLSELKQRTDQLEYGLHARRRRVRVKKHKGKKTKLTRLKNKNLRSKLKRSHNKRGSLRARRKGKTR